MKLSVALTAASLIALSVAGGLYASTNADKPSAEPKSQPVQEQISGAPDVRQAKQMSEHGLAAVNDIHLARIAVNDGYIDNAKQLLEEARSLLDQVAAVDPPVTVTTEIKVGDEPMEKQTVTKKPDLIPILAEMQLVEGFAPTDAAAAADAPSAAQSADGTPMANQQPSSDAKSADQAATTEAKVTDEQRAVAVKQAQRQLQNGDQQAAAATLRLVDLGLISRVVSMPLQATSDHVNTAMALIEAGKLHEANLELKRVKEGLILDTSVAVEPATTAPSAQPAEKHSDAGSDSAAESTSAG